MASPRKKPKKAPETFRFEATGEAMPKAGDMRRLTEEIMNSFDARMAGLAALKQETATKLNGFRQGMKNVQHALRREAADLKRFLGDAHARRMRDFRAMHQRIEARQDDRNRDVAGLLDRFRRENRAAGGHWRNMAVTMASRRASATR